MRIAVDRPMPKIVTPVTVDNAGTWFLKSTTTFIMTSVSVGKMYSVPLAPFFSHVSNAL